MRGGVGYHGDGAEDMVLTEAAHNGGDVERAEAVAEHADGLEEGDLAPEEGGVEGYHGGAAPGGVLVVVVGWFVGDGWLRAASEALYRWVVGWRFGG